MTASETVRALFREEHFSYSEISTFLKCPRHYVRAGGMSSRQLLTAKQLTWPPSDST